MKVNGFDSDDYRYFWLNKSCDWSDQRGFTYKQLEENDIIKITHEQLKWFLFNSNFSLRIYPNIYEYHRKDYPKEEPFDLFKYISMQDPITFKYDGTLKFIYNAGEYAFINKWMHNKLNSESKSEDIFYGSIQEKNREMMDKIYDDEKIEVNSTMLLPEDISKKELTYFEKFKLFRFKTDMKFEIGFHKDETWSPTNTSVFFALFDQDFIRLLSNSTEILGKDKEDIFLQEYEDNIPNTTRRYYRIKDDVRVKSISQLCGELSLDNLGKNFHSLIIRTNTDLNICEYNRDNYNSDGSIKYFYIDYTDSFNDRIAEKEILKVAVRLSQKEALVRYKMDLEAIRRKELEKEALEYVKKHYSTYKKRKDRSMTPVDFLESERNKLEKRLVKILSNRLQKLQ